MTAASSPAALSFEIGDVLIETFSIPHDAQDPVGYLLRTNGVNLGFLTDLGHATKLVLERVRPAHALILESNHDVKMLQDCPRRPWSLKQRILGRHGHLSNEAAADAAQEIMSAELTAPVSRPPEQRMQQARNRPARHECAPPKNRRDACACGSCRARGAVRDAALVSHGNHRTGKRSASRARRAGIFTRSQIVRMSIA